MGYTYIKQHDAADCGVACMSMICSYYKKDMSLTRLRDMMGTDDCGTNLSGMQYCAKKLGFESLAVRVDKEGFFEKYPLPAVANVITKKGFSHFVVIFKITHQHVIIGDPAKRILSLTIEEFLRKFTGVLMLLEPGEDFVEEKGTKKNIFSYGVEWIKPHRKLFAAGVVMMVLAVILQLSGSAFYYVIYDKILGTGNANTLSFFLAVFFIMLLTQSGVGFLQKLLSGKLSKNIDIPMMASYIEHIYHLPVSFFASRRTGDMVNRVSDGFAVKELYTRMIPACMVNVGMMLFSGVVMAVTNKEMFLLCILLSTLSVLCGFLMQRKLGVWKEKQVQQSTEVSSQMVEGIFAMETLKANAGENVQIQSIKTEYKKLIELEYKMAKICGSQESLQELMAGIGNLLLLYCGMLQVMAKELSLGGLLAFVTLYGFFREPINQMVQMQFAFKESDISMKRVTEVLEYPAEEKEEQQVLSRIQGDVEFNHVTFQYGMGKPVLQDISFTIPRGRKVALVGGSGSGKSTIAKLLLRYYDTSSGEILIEDKDVKQYKHSSVRKAIAYVPQTMQLFSKSIYDNIRISRPEATREEIVEAAKSAGAHEFISRLPKQYNTCLEEGGNGLSVGERQRIVLARAFLKKSDFWILDESTSNLDYRTEQEVFSKIYKEYPNTSMLIIAHRLSTIKECDEILVLEQGKIVERGSHEELLKRQGHYYNLWKMQR